eukprot:EG_transcript_56908
MTTMDADSVQVLPDALRFRATPSRPLRWSREAEFGPLEEVVVPALQIHAVAREGKTGVRVVTACGSWVAVDDAGAYDAVHSYFMSIESGGPEAGPPPPLIRMGGGGGQPKP